MSILQRAFLFSFGIHLCLLCLVGLWPLFRSPPVQEKKVLTLSSLRLEQAVAPVKPQTQKSINHATKQSSHEEIQKPVEQNMPSKAPVMQKRDEAVKKPVPKPTKIVKKNTNTELKKNAEKESSQNANKENKQIVNEERRIYENKEINKDVNTGMGNGSPNREIALARAKNNIDAYRRRLAEKLAQAKFYPKLAQRRGMEGKVMVHFVIDRAGTIRSMQIKESSGYAMLDEAALDAVYSIGRFDPFPEGITDAQLEITFAMVYKLTD